MKKFSCPHCGKATISLWQKWKISPLSDTRCEACGSKLSTRYAWGLFALSPMIVGSPLLLALNVVASERGQWLVLAGAFITSMLLLTFAVPIVATNDSSEEQRT
jgi:DNA-directed RNA polymerase subunit RPC12/RpoP